MTQEVMDALLLHEIKVMYESSINELVKFHDLLCNLRLKVKELEADLRFKEKRGGIVINKEEVEKEDIEFYVELLNEVIRTLENVIRRLKG
jgi:spore germination protein YaaH